MDQMNHKHSWKVLIGAQHNDSSGDNDSAVFKCDGCGLRLHASDAIQFELLKYTTGWNKWVSVIALLPNKGF
jgi:hypothetical protein